MNRRSFMKAVSGALAGVIALPSKVKDNQLAPKAKGALKCGGQNGSLCPRCKFNCKGCSTGIDSNSDWSKQTIKFRTYVQSPNYRMFFDRVLTQDEIKLLHREPFCMFKKSIRPVLNPNHPLTKGLIGYELFIRT